MEEQEKYWGTKAQEAIEPKEELRRLEHNCKVALSNGDQIIASALMEGLYQAYISDSSSKEEAHAKLSEYLDRVIPVVNAKTSQAQELPRMLSSILEYLEVKVGVNLAEKKADLGRQSREDVLEKLQRDISEKRRDKEHV